MDNDYFSWLSRNWYYFVECHMHNNCTYVEYLDRVADGY